MPLYEYEHCGAPCDLGAVFEVEQPMSEAALTRCPACNGEVKKLISLTMHFTPRSNREIRDAGFSKLVKRDDGVYENVTRRDGEAKVVEHGDSAALASLRPALSD